MMRHVDAGFDDEPVVRSYAVTHPRGHVVLPQPPGWDQVLLAASGVMTVHTDGAAWLVTSDRAVWAPSGSAHRIVVEGRARVRSVYVASGIVPEPGTCRAVEVTPFVRELVLLLVERAPVLPGDAEGGRLVAVLADQMPRMRDAALRVPLPHDPRALDVARALLDDPSDPRPVDQLARGVGASRRTIERLFLSQTGMSVGRWRTRVRLVEAVRLLSLGVPVTRVATDVGYSTPSAFGVAFRRGLGTSPGRYLPTVAAEPSFRDVDAGR